MLTEVHIKYINVGSYLIMVTSPHSRRSFLRTFDLRNTHYVLYASLVEDVGCVLNHPTDQILPVFNAARHLFNSDYS